MAASAKDELELLERVFLRVASAETDDQLEKTVKTFLCPLLLKVASPHQEVKNKVMTLLTHLNKRLKSRPKIQLPVDSLLLQYQDVSIPAFVANFAILYLRMGFPRLPPETQMELAPLLIKCIQDKPQPQQDCLLQLVLPVLGQMKIPDSIDERQKMFEFKEKPVVAGILLDFLLDVLLMPYSTTSKQPSVDTPGSESDTAESEQTSASSPDSLAPPGMSVAAVKRVTADSPLESKKLEQMKLGALKFLARDLFEPSDVICHFLAATGDTRHSVLDTADHELKRISSSTDFENPKVVNKMFGMFQGTTSIAGSAQQAAQIPADQKRSPAGIRLKQRIYPYLLRSRRAADQFPACLQIIFDSLFGKDLNGKLRVYAVQFVHHICLWSSDKVINMMGPVLLSGMTKLINEDKQVCIHFLMMLLTGTVLLSHSVLNSLNCRKDDVKEEAKKGLRAVQVVDRTSTEDSTNKDILPAFPDMVSYVARKSLERLRGKYCYTAGTTALPFAPPVFSQVLLYLQKCLEHAAGVTEEDRVKNCILPPVGEYVNKLLIGINTEDFSSSAMGKYIELTRQALEPIGGADLHAVAMCCLLQAVAVAPKQLAGIFHGKLDWIKGFTFSSREDARQYAGQLLAVVTCTMSEDSFVNVIKELSASVDSEVSFVLQIRPIGLYFNSWNICKLYFCCSVVDSKTQSSAAADPVSKLSVVEKLLDTLQNAKENKVKEHAAHALGFLLVGDEHFPHHKKLIDGLCEASKIRQVELQFTVGEALSCAGAGRMSEVARDPWVVEQLKSTASGENGGTMQELIDMIVNKYATSPIPYVRQVSQYQYDPNTKIQQAMTSIWAALVPETKKTVDKYVNEILEDLKTSLGSNIWRVRQSSCMALSDLLSGRSVDDMLESLPRLWELCFRARDDIKESVRQAAEVACRTLSKVSIRVCDVNQGKLGETAIALVLPTLLHKGVANSAEEVRSISLSTIVKISKNAGALLKPHIPLLVIALLESLSGLENQSMNYLSLQLHKREDAQEMLEGARIAASKMSPMMETINMCVQYVDATVLPALVPRLSDLLRTGVGLGTKAGSAGFVVSLAMQCSQDLTPFAGKLLNALLSGLSDRSASVRKSYATAIGHLVKVAKDNSVEKLIDKIKNWYFEKEDEGLRLACGLTLQAMSRYSPDVMKRHTAKALPAVFFAMHEKKTTAGSSSSSNESLWEEIWLENTPGTEAGIRLYLDEIVSITCPALTSQSWTTKAQAAVTISAIAQKLGSSLSQPYLGKLLGSLVSGLVGRTWTGKEALLSALSCVCIKCRKSIEESSPRVDPDIEKVLDSVFKECRKDNPTYKMAALKCFGEIVQEYSIDRFQQLSELLFPIIAPEPKEEGEEGEDENEDEEEKDKKVNQEFLVCAFDCLGQSWPKNATDSQDKHAERFCSILTNALTSNTWKVQLVVLSAIKLFIERMDWISGTPDGSTEESIDRIAMLRSTLGQFIPPVCECLEVKKYAAVRLGAVEVLEAVHTALKGHSRLSLLTEELKEHILDSLKYVYSDKEPNIRDKAAKLKNKLLSLGS
ncbi:proteasome-associated protein ECM29 homolog [Orbicella faveolata]|uniref:proteasome-associated protein ECM29 homolog n=1 Tax=Orbicella faveolata TaxID=48498 RepID=UPI0009E5E336|nr:proteasome-associated protein ECM29 homolog [Orbicella faveolata]